jgi:hypothetical protein
MDKVKKWFANIRQYENLSFGGARTLGDIEKEYDKLKQRSEAGQHETIVIPQDDCEKQAWFIITVMRNMNKDEVEMLCKNLLVRFDIDLGKLIQHVNQIKDEKLTV